MTIRRSGSRKRGLFFYTVPLDCALILCGALAALWRPSPSWVEQHFSNGYYPGWQHFWSHMTQALPFALGDAIIAGAALTILLALLAVRPWWRAALGAAAVPGLCALWFYAGWGFGYDRGPLQDRVSYTASQVNEAAMNALRARAMGQMNRLAPLAHARAGRAVDIAALREAWLPVVRRLGDRWTPLVHAAKPPLAGWFMDKTGTSGFTNPFTLETQLAPDLLWFERPFDQAHEWSHVAGFNREDEANYIAALTCLRDGDSVAQYSGWLELFLYLPQKQQYAKRDFVPQVWSDFAAMRRRNAHFVNLNLARFSWRVYNRYLKTNHVASGVQNYDEVTRLMLGIARDARGLPEGLGKQPSR